MPSFHVAEVLASGSGFPHRQAPSNNPCRSGGSRELLAPPPAEAGEGSRGWPRFELIQKPPDPPLPLQGREQRARGFRRSYGLKVREINPPVAATAPRRAGHGRRAAERPAPPALPHRPAAAAAC